MSNWKAIFRSLQRPKPNLANLISDVAYRLSDINDEISYAEMEKRCLALVEKARQSGKVVMWDSLTEVYGGKKK
jgi:hypothetical protein